MALNSWRPDKFGLILCFNSYGVFLLFAQAGVWFCSHIEWFMAYFHKNRGSLEDIKRACARSAQVLIPLSATPFWGGESCTVSLCSVPFWFWWVIIASDSNSPPWLECDTFMCWPVWVSIFASSNLYDVIIAVKVLIIVLTGCWSGEEVREWMWRWNKGWNEKGTRSKLHQSPGGAEEMSKV